MAREILFRGKRTDNGRWIFGNRLYDDISGKHYIVLSRHIIDSYTTVNPDGEFKRLHCTGVEVVPETIGQYTGLKDKDGKKIFEGDIVLLKDDEKAKVIWGDDNAKFILDYDNINADFDNFWGYELETIGNIYDNPELLEAE